MTHPSRFNNIPLMGLELIPDDVRGRYQIEERLHACSILESDFPDEWADILGCLDTFVLKRSDVLTAGGNKSPISKAIDAYLNARGWDERSFDTAVVVDGVAVETPTHKIDNFKNRIGVEVEWNNKDPFFDRDLNNFRLLHQLGVLSVGVIITRLWELQQEFIKLGKGASYGMNTTHFGKLLPKVNGGGAGGCPLLLVGMGFGCYDPHS
ncbi:MAG: BglII/BstYI family type II restriction endonuclease [Planctomycetota bacterium]